MKRLLPWLLVPAAAWLGYQGVRQTPPLHIASPQAVVTQTRVATESAVLGNLNRSELERRFGETLANPSSDGNIPELRLMCARWAELDPAAGLAWIGTQKPKLASLLRSWLLTEWALLDSEAAWAALPAGPDGDQDRRAITSELLYEDRELFMKWFRRVRQPTPDDDPAWLMVAERHTAEFEKIALEILAERKDPSDDVGYRVKPFYDILARLRAEKDPASAFEWAGTIDPAFHPAAYRAVLKAWAKIDPLEAWKRLASFDSDVTKGVYMDANGGTIGGQILTRIATNDPTAAMKLIQEVKSTRGIFGLGGIEAMQTVIGSAVSKGEMDPVNAYRLLNSAKGSASNLPMNVFMKMWTGMSEERLAEAAKGILTEPDDHLRGTALSGIAGAWMRNNPEAAFAFISGIEDANLRKDVFAGTFISANGGNQDASAQARILQQVTPSDRAGVFTSYLASYGYSYAEVGSGSYDGSEIRPELFAPLFEDLPPSADLNRAVNATALKWGELDPASALAWADKVADPAARQAAYAGTFQGWAHHDPFAAAEWLAKKPAGAERDAAALPLVRRLSDSDPADAWEWASSIGDTSLQTEARVSAFRSWSQRSPEEANAAYQKYAATLSPAEAAKFAKQLSEK